MEHDFVVNTAKHVIILYHDTHLNDDIIKAKEFQEYREFFLNKKNIRDLEKLGHFITNYSTKKKIINDSNSFKEYSLKESTGLIKLSQDNNFSEKFCKKIGRDKSSGKFKRLNTVFLAEVSKKIPGSAGKLWARRRPRNKNGTFTK